MTAERPSRPFGRWLHRNHGFADRLHAVGWDYVSTNCEVRRWSHNATKLPKVP
ncbi:hypothetical protein [Micropruina sonneratiae]|uniref:hypothetical protein n=1 Tax=Micropruina sonneratiae TaxID=2986940 RepID=UPI0022262D34|nr:hypothetical protein [Micropruina sp. KQZ13P-5]MCW3159181.1 hypothetical protein [Micropruina sp. KQZ13P-5]